MRHRKKWIILALLVAMFVALRLLRTGPTIAQGGYLLVDLHGEYVEGQPRPLLTRLLEERPRLGDLLSNLEKVTRDDRIAGVIVQIGSLGTGWGQADEIRDALTEIKASGKKVIAEINGEVFGGNREYYVASAADRIYIPPAGSPFVNGLSAHYMFLGGVWEKLGMSMDVEQIREYKTFGDMLARRSMSEAHRRMANSILDDIDHRFLSKIADSRGLTVDALQQRIDAPPVTAQAFVDAGLADGIEFVDDIRSELGGGKPVPLVTEDDYSKVSRSELGLGGGSKIAVIHASGILVSGDSIGRTVMGESVGSNTIVKAFKDATSDHDVKAIVFRIDSPGGSPYAADEIWKEIRTARAKKPVIASLGNVAASGGYYIAAAADRILTDPMTLTGSIGVVMFKPNLAGLLDRVGISEDSLSRGRYSRLMDVTKGLDDQERKLIQTQMGGIYDMFLKRVATGRGMKAADVDKIGGGRVWTGSQAVNLHLADEIGGFKEAVAKAAEAASIRDPSSVELVFYPQPKGLMQQLVDLGGAKLEVAMPSWLGSQVAQLIEASTLRPGIYALLPAQLTIR